MPAIRPLANRLRASAIDRRRMSPSLRLAGKGDDEARSSDSLPQGAIIVFLTQNDRSLFCQERINCRVEARIARPRCPVPTRTQSRPFPVDMAHLLRHVDIQHHPRCSALQSSCRSHFLPKVSAASLLPTNACGRQIHRSVDFGSRCCRPALRNGATVGCKRRPRCAHKSLVITTHLIP